MKEKIKIPNVWYSYLKAMIFFVKFLKFGQNCF